MSNSRSSFSLSELMIAIGIISILVSLLVAMLQDIREKSRRSECAHQLRDIAIACHTYHDSYKRLPPGTLGFTPAVDFYADWVVSSSEYYWVRSQQTSCLGMIDDFLNLG